MSNQQVPSQFDQLSGLQRAHIRTVPCDDAGVKPLYEHAVHLMVKCGADDTGAPDSPGTPCNDSSPEDEPQEQRCWVHRVTYLEHSQKTEGPVKRPAPGDQKDQAPNGTMEAIEVFTETEHGNLAYFDQLMIGFWS